MVIIESTINYLIQNWVSIIIAIVLSSIFYLLSSRGLKKAIVSRQEERLKTAKESIVDVLEYQIINNSEMNINKIIHLLNATSRERDVNLNQEYKPIDILEDLELRFAKSKHLKNEQRAEYTEKIEDLMQKKEEPKIIIGPPNEKIITNLELAIENRDEISIKRNIDVLKSKLIIQNEEKNVPDRMIDIISSGATIIAFLFFVMIELINISSIQILYIIIPFLIIASIFYIITKK